MNLYRVHRIVMTSAIALGVLFAVYSGVQYRSTGERLAAFLAALSAAASAGLSLYLRWFLLTRARPPASRHAR